MKGSFITVFIFLVLLLLAGCAATASSGKTDSTQVPALEPAALLKFNDVPIPSSFNFVPGSSYAFQSAGFRAALLTYIGKGTGDQVVSFFKEQMPLYNWSMINVVEYDRRILSFEKEDENCIITVESKGGRTEIMISVAPKSKAYYKKPARYDDDKEEAAGTKTKKKVIK